MASRCAWVRTTATRCFGDTRFIPLAILLTLCAQAEGQRVGDPSASEILVVHQVLIDDVRHEDGPAYYYKLPIIFVGWTDDSQQIDASRLVVLEDGEALGPAHAIHDDIRRIGEGRYSHWKRGILFSTSDNTDPRTNGRQYSVGLRQSEAVAQFFDPLTPPPPRIEAVIEPPILDLLAQDLVGQNGRLQLTVTHPNDALLYYWEVDVVPTFDSPVLHREPLLGVSAGGPNPLTILQREAEFGKRFEMPYRIGALAEIPEDRADDLLQVVAMRLGFELSPELRVREVYECVRYQVYPRDTSMIVRSPVETMLVDRGLCRNTNGLCASLLDVLGVATRLIHVSTGNEQQTLLNRIRAHVSCEVYTAGQWSIVDPWLDVLVPSVSMRAISEGKGPGSMVVLRERPRVVEAVKGDIRSNVPVDVCLADYAKNRRYFRGLDGRHLIQPTSAELEELLFAGEPRHVPDLPFDVLWPEPIMEVWIRTRGLEVARDQMAWRFFGQGPAKRPEVIVGTPWTTVFARIDLRAAYGLHDGPAVLDARVVDPDESGASTPGS